MNTEKREMFGTLSLEEDHWPELHGFKLFDRFNLIVLTREECERAGAMAGAVAVDGIEAIRFFDLLHCAVRWEIVKLASTEDRPWEAVWIPYDRTLRYSDPKGQPIEPDIADAKGMAVTNPEWLAAPIEAELHYYRGDAEPEVWFARQGKRMWLKLVPNGSSFFIVFKLRIRMT